ncbi:MAG: hypothetical protein K6F79_03115 [Saccharofermentans sp.]|nr:hypothetical protein [Saccharofermentans sp.]
MNSASGHDKSFTDKVSGIFASVVRTTVKLFRNFPSYVKNKIQRKIKEYNKKPKREDINKVYVLIGYTTKEHIDSKHNAERNLIILRNGLLMIITLLILFISFNAVLPHIDFAQYGEMFGISSVDDMTRNDPFTNVTVAESVNVQESSFAVAPSASMQQAQPSAIPSN